MANQVDGGYIVLNDKLGLIDDDCTPDAQQAINLKKVERHTTESLEHTIALEQWLEDQTHGAQSIRAGTTTEERGTPLGNNANILGPQQIYSSSGYGQNGHVSSGFQTYSAGSDSQGGVFIPPVYTPAATITTTDKTPTSVPHIPDYLAFSIVTTIFCFFPISIFAIISSIKAHTLKTTGDYTKAKEKATQALHLNILSIVMGVICYVFTGLLVWYDIKRTEKLANQY